MSYISNNFLFTEAPNISESTVDLYNKGQTQCLVVRFMSLEPIIQRLSISSIIDISTIICYFPMLKAALRDKLKRFSSFHLKVFVSYCCFLFFFINLFIYLLLAVSGLRCCARASSSCGVWGLLFIAV